MLFYSLYVFNNALYQASVCLAHTHSEICLLFMINVVGLLGVAKIIVRIIIGFSLVLPQSSKLGLLNKKSFLATAGLLSWLRLIA